MRFRSSLVFTLAAALCILPMLFGGSVRASQSDNSFPTPPPLDQSKLTDGWKQIHFKFEVQHPYNLPLSDRYFYDQRDDIHHLWVFFTDKPHLPPPNRTTARTEIAIEPYSSAPHLFDADYYVMPGTFACVMQLFRGNSGPGLLLVVSPNGRLSELRSGKVLASNVFNHWFNLKVVHYPGVRNGVTIYVNDVLRYTFNIKRSKAYYFKCGVYSREKSKKSEVFIHAIRCWVKNPTTQPVE